MNPDALAAMMGQQSPPQEDQGPPQADNPEDYLRQALDLVREYAQEHQVDDELTLKAEKITTLIQEILAGSFKEKQDALGGKMSPRVLQQAYSGAEAQ